MGFSIEDFFAFGVKSSLLKRVKRSEGALHLFTIRLFEITERELICVSFNSNCLRKKFFFFALLCIIFLFDF